MIDDETSKYISELEQSRNEYAMLLVALFQHIIGPSQDSEDTLSVPQSLIDSATKKVVEVAKNTNKVGYTITVRNK